MNQLAKIVENHRYMSNKDLLIKLGQLAYDIYFIKSTIEKYIMKQIISLLVHEIDKRSYLYSK